MTLDELLATPKDILSPIERQMRFLTSTWLVPMPCPHCDRPFNEVEAHFGEIGKDHRRVEWNEIGGGTNKKYDCPHCGQPVRRHIDLVCASQWMRVKVK